MDECYIYDNNVFDSIKFNNNNNKMTQSKHKVKIFLQGFIIGAYIITLVNDLILGFHFKGFIFGTSFLIIILVLLEAGLKQEEESTNE